MKPLIKICGITNLEDAKLSVALGADLLGFNFYKPSPRYIEPKMANEIIKGISGDVKSVGVFVNAGLAGIEDVLKKCPLYAAQLHGDETNDECQGVLSLGVDVIKALRINTSADIDNIYRYDVKSVLLDAFREDVYGGSGHVFDWSWLQGKKDRKIYLAGGVNPDNILAALQVNTYGIDLCSGVESIPGRKDHEKMMALFDYIHRF